MGYYLTIFIISIWAIKKASISSLNLNVYLYSFIALFPPIILAGIRDHTVGSDVDFYILKVFNSACMVDGNYTILKEIESFEPLYLILNCITAKLSHNPVAILVAIQTAILLPIYITAMRMRKYISPAYFMFVYYFMFYNDSLSIVRQSISLGFMMLALSYFFENKKIHCFIFFTISIGFHITSIIGLVIPLIYKITQYYSFRKHFKIYILMFVLTSLTFAYLDDIILLLIYKSIIDEKYIIYTSQSDTFSGNLGISSIIVSLSVIIYVLIYFYKSKYIKESSFFFFIISILDFIFSFSGLITNHLSRISLYFKIFSCFTLSYINYRIYIHLTRTSIIVMNPKVVISFLIIIYWVYVYIYGNYNNTANYIINNKIIW